MTKLISYYFITNLLANLNSIGNAKNFSFHRSLQSRIKPSFRNLLAFMLEPMALLIGWAPKRTYVSIDSTKFLSLTQRKFLISR
ncbi:hypothetical protein CO115_02545 [Candidatus Falkowbacteria bacterium CG_4_9_14_3_um_filter_36_9]|nr:MAG: hypothetical protein CO115_02545 [Candidatus Falkowbacteria bacterium CG_4_9_14_3_um_filter_36_9]